MTIHADRVFARIATSDLQIAISVTGGGIGVIGQCFGRVGASRHFVHAAVPYSRRALADWIGRIPDASVSRRTAADMADASRRMAARMADRPGGTPIGFSMTACLPTDPLDPTATHQLFLAATTRSRMFRHHVVLSETGREAAERRAERAFLVWMDDVVRRLV